MEKNLKSKTILKRLKKKKSNTTFCKKKKKKCNWKNLHQYFTYFTLKLQSYKCFFSSPYQNVLVSRKNVHEKFLVTSCSAIVLQILEFDIFYFPEIKSHTGREIGFSFQWLHYFLTRVELVINQFILRTRT